MSGVSGVSGWINGNFSSKRNCVCVCSFLIRSLTNNSRNNLVSFMLRFLVGGNIVYYYFAHTHIFNYKFSRLFLKYKDFFIKS